MNYMGLITLRQASAFTGISEAALFEAIHRKHNNLPAFRAGSHLMIPTKAFEEWINSEAIAYKEIVTDKDTLKKIIIDVIEKLLDNNKGKWYGSCTELTEQIYAITFNDICKSPAISLGKLLSGMDQMFAAHSIKHISVRRARGRIHMFTRITK